MEVEVNSQYGHGQVVRRIQFQNCASSETLLTNWLDGLMFLLEHSLWPTVKHKVQEESTGQLEFDNCTKKRVSEIYGQLEY